MNPIVYNLLNFSFVTPKGCDSTEMVKHEDYLTMLRYKETEIELLDKRLSEAYEHDMKQREKIKFLEEELKIVSNDRQNLLKMYEELKERIKE